MKSVWKLQIDELICHFLSSVLIKKKIRVKFFRVALLLFHLHLFNKAAINLLVKPSENHERYAVVVGRRHF